MARHVFLTGEKQIGKSTLLKKVLDNYAGEISGFFHGENQSFSSKGLFRAFVLRGRNGNSRRK